MRFALAAALALALAAVPGALGLGMIAYALGASGLLR
jgi:hypothetical protein